MEHHPENWFSTADEGQLSVDVFRDGNDLVVRSFLAGVKAEDLDLSVHDDLLTIRGERSQERKIAEDNWYSRECYWGSFSRSIVLPHEVDAERVSASMANGVLEIRIPIRKEKKSIDVKWE